MLTSTELPILPSPPNILIPKHLKLNNNNNGSIGTNSGEVCFCGAAAVVFVLPYQDLAPL